MLCFLWETWKELREYSQHWIRVQNASKCLFWPQNEVTCYLLTSFLIWKFEVNVSKTSLSHFDSCWLFWLCRYQFIQRCPDHKPLSDIYIIHKSCLLSCLWVRLQIFALIHCTVSEEKIWISQSSHSVTTFKYIVNIIKTLWKMY